MGTASPPTDSTPDHHETHDLDRAQQQVILAVHSQPGPRESLELKAALAAAFHAHELQQPLDSWMEAVATELAAGNLYVVAPNLDLTEVPSHQADPAEALTEPPLHPHIAPARRELQHMPTLGPDASRLLDDTADLHQSAAETSESKVRADSCSSAAPQAGSRHPAHDTPPVCAGASPANAADDRSASRSGTARLAALASVVVIAILAAGRLLRKAIRSRR